MIPFQPRELQGPRERGDDLSRRVPGAALLEPRDIVHLEPGEVGELFAPEPARATVAPGDESGIRGGQAVSPCSKQLAEALRSIHPTIITRTDQVVPGTDGPTVEEGTGWPFRILRTWLTYRSVRHPRERLLP